ncbi:GNAT family N-acetyltransferase [Chryseobacterium sp. SIMBA_029]|uniref:GNAT family N-acetyltransferase n=1 Tax=Chryseobacterium sp. SIMBA_029 TaxID=3085772 RepID=UPI00397D59D8
MTLPQYDSFPTVTGEGVPLRQILDSDLQDLIEISFYDAIQAETVEQAAEMQSKINKDYTNGNSIHWAIIDNTTQKVVGTCGYYRGFDNGNGELGCVMLPQYYGKGYMTAAMSLAIDFGLKNIGLQRVWAATSQQNTKAIQLLERLNFRRTVLLENDEIEFEFNPNK